MNNTIFHLRVKSPYNRREVRPLCQKNHRGETLSPKLEKVNCLACQKILNIGVPLEVI